MDDIRHSCSFSSLVSIAFAAFSVSFPSAIRVESVSISGLADRTLDFPAREGSTAGEANNGTGFYYFLLVVNRKKASRPSDDGKLKTRTIGQCFRDA